MTQALSTGGVLAPSITFQADNPYYVQLLIAAMRSAEKELGSRHATSKWIRGITREYDLYQEASHSPGNGAALPSFRLAADLDTHFVLLRGVLCAIEEHCAGLPLLVRGSLSQVLLTNLRTKVREFELFLAPTTGVVEAKGRSQMS